MAPSIRGTQSRTVFAYLVLNRTRQVARDELADVLWGAAPPPQPATALRALLSKLRGSLAATGAAALPTGDLLHLHLPADAWIDVEAAVQALHDAQSAVAQNQNVPVILYNVPGRTVADLSTETTLRLADVPRIVGINDHSVDMPPSSHMLVVRNSDTPGMIGKVTTTLGDAGINIADMDVGTNAAGEAALMVLSTYSPVPLEIVERLRSIPGVFDARAIDLD